MLYQTFFCHTIFSFFFSSQLRIAPNPRNLVFDISSFLDERKNKKGQKEILVRYLGYPDPKFDEWVLEKDIIENEG